MTTQTLDTAEQITKAFRDEAARKRVLTNAATILGIPPDHLLKQAGIKESLDKIVDESDKNHQEFLKQVGIDADARAAVALEDSRVRDELLYAISSNFFIDREGLPILADARKAFKARFLPDRWVKGG